MKNSTGSAIRKRREVLGISQAELARRVGIKQPSLHNIEIGETKRSRYLPEIASALGLDPQALRGGKAVSSGVATFADSLPQNSQRDFPVYFTKPGGEDVALVISTEAIEYVERPSLLANVKESFGVCVYGDAMAPAYKAGDTLFVHPHKPPTKGSDVVLRAASVNDAQIHIHIGELEAETETDWRVKPYNNISRKLKKSDWRCHRIVAKYNR